MRIKRVLVQPALIVCLLGGLEPVLAKDHSKDYPAASAMFLRLFDYLDADGDGAVPLADLFRELGLEDAEARQVKSIRGLDQNSDGTVARAEGLGAMIGQIEYQVQRALGTDADGDGELSLLEYALSYPNRSGQAPDADGVTAEQRDGFRYYDLDGDGIATRAEIVSVRDQGYARSYWAQLMALKIKPLDRDGDGSLDRTERAPLKDWEPEGAEDRLTVREVSYWLYRVKPNDYPGIEAQINKIGNQTLHAEH